MKPVEIISNAMFFRAPDGRIIYRPLGNWGQCYLLTESQRLTRARIKLGAQIAMLTFFATWISQYGIGTEFWFIVPAWIAGDWLLLWLFSLGLPTTPAPPKPDAAFIRERRKMMNQNFGKPLLWVALIIASLMSITGVLACLVLGDYAIGLAIAGFFGLCAWVFAKRLRDF